MGDPDFLFIQCLNDLCRLRFPVVVEGASIRECPRCGSEVVVVAANDKPDSLHPNGQTDGPKWVGILDNIRSIHNTGSMFRTADGAGFAHLYLCGITPTPEHPRLANAALGSQNTVNWTYSPNGVDLATSLLDNGYRLWALERIGSMTPATTNTIYPDSQMALVVGNEKAGVDPVILSLCEGVIGLPMVGHKSSLNVAVAFGIAAYHLRFGSDALIWQK
ncbi:MAG: TrmH family RNA methyltransferase [Chloroflexota bacterium]|jgi:23S rRNA (guanosine2251-2'-O)-methyltransferase